jgi:hypothetical protein
MGEGGRYSGRVGVGATHGSWFIGRARSQRLVLRAPNDWDSAAPHLPLRGFFPHKEAVRLLGKDRGKK